MSVMMQSTRRHAVADAILAAMDVPGATLIAVVATSLLVLAAAIGIFIGAVWLGLRVIAPRLRQAVDRAEEDDHDRD